MLLCGYETRRNSQLQISHYLIKEVSPLALNFQAFNVISYGTIYCNFSDNVLCITKQMLLFLTTSQIHYLVFIPACLTRMIRTQSYLSVTHSTEFLSFAVVMFIKLPRTLNQQVLNYCSQRKYRLSFLLQASDLISVTPKCHLYYTGLPTSL